MVLYNTMYFEGSGSTLITEARLQTILNHFRDQRILVIGDFYLDAYWDIDKTRSTLSLETPWHTNPVVEQRYSPGAAGTVTNNLKALGVGTVYTLGVIGEDGFGRTLLNCLQASGCLTDFMVQVPNWVTPTYLKPIHRGYEGVETEGPRFDIENQAPMATEVEASVIDALQACMPLVDGIIVGDQMPLENLGVVTNHVRAELCELALAAPELSFLPTHVRGLVNIKTSSLNRTGLRRNALFTPNGVDRKLTFKRQSSVPSLSQRERKRPCTSPSVKTVSSSTVRVSSLTSLASPLMMRPIRLARETAFRQDLWRHFVALVLMLLLMPRILGIWWLRLLSPKSGRLALLHPQKSLNATGALQIYERF